MANVIYYLCDKKKRPCRDHCQMGLSECTHTLDPDHALNGAIDPQTVWLYPDRFAFVDSNHKTDPARRIEYYEEKVPAT